VELILPSSLLLYYTRLETSVTTASLGTANFIHLASTCPLTTLTKSYPHKLLQSFLCDAVSTHKIHQSQVHTNIIALRYSCNHLWPAERKPGLTAIIEFELEEILSIQVVFKLNLIIAPTCCNCRELTLYHTELWRPALLLLRHCTLELTGRSVKCGNTLLWTAWHTFFKKHNFTSLPSVYGCLSVYRHNVSSPCKVVFRICDGFRSVTWKPSNSSFSLLHNYTSILISGLISNAGCRPHMQVTMGSNIWPKLAQVTHFFVLNKSANVRVQSLLTVCKLIDKYQRVGRLSM